MFACLDCESSLSLLTAEEGRQQAAAVQNELSRRHDLGLGKERKKLLIEIQLAGLPGPHQAGRPNLVSPPACSFFSAAKKLSIRALS